MGFKSTCLTFFYFRLWIGSVSWAWICLSIEGCTFLFDTEAMAWWCPKSSCFHFLLIWLFVDKFESRLQNLFLQIYYISLWLFLKKNWGGSFLYVFFWLTDLYGVYIKPVVPYGGAISKPHIDPALIHRYLPEELLFEVVHWSALDNLASSYLSCIEFSWCYTICVQPPFFLIVDSICICMII